MGEKMRIRNLKLDEKFVVELKDYAVDGGGFPIRIVGVEGVVGAVIVSGLSQEDDHQLAVDGINQFLGGPLKQE